MLLAFVENDRRLKILEKTPTISRKYMELTKLPLFLLLLQGIKNG